MRGTYENGTVSRRARMLLKKFWLPLLSFVLLVVACTDTNHYDGRKVAHEFSGTIYEIYILATVALLLGLTWKQRSLRLIRYVVELVALTFIVTNVLKYAVHLPRPPHMHHGVATWHAHFSPGFPSAHTAFAFGLAWLVFAIKPRLAIPWFAVAVGVGWSRVELFAHYPYQVWFGALLGCLLGLWISSWQNGIYTSIAQATKRLAENKKAAHSNRALTATFTGFRPL